MVEILNWMGAVLMLFCALAMLCLLGSMFFMSYIWFLVMKREFRASEPRTDLVPVHEHNYDKVIRGETDEFGERVLKSCRCGDEIVEKV